MRLILSTQNIHNGVRYRLIFDSRQWRWVLYAKDEWEPVWVRLCWFYDLDAAELLFSTLTAKMGVKAHKPFKMESMI